ncbi:extracellular solute-binding protein [Methylomonas sp. SURF-2]|uniref:Extracellular solute-binding protein n=1 Tax=Methylomonas subterranea TaxID=2952225 RepID=A0ABT1TLP2_9GAMM|nr:extracellular solute-binding protein [Methylomonas sp. SURF-2]MCQ8106007.1 extracellular solute-binding protein [Methylomonas sp. SURF-2]
MLVKAAKAALPIVCLLLLLSGRGMADARTTLRVLSWPGYADPEVVTQFQQRYKVEVEITVVSSDDDLWYKINNGNFDVFAVNTAELQRYIERNLALPVDIGHIPNHKNQLPRFQNLAEIPGLTHDGKLYAVPYTYSEMGLIYNRSIVKTAPTSMAALWDSAYRGRVLAFNASNHNFSLVGLLMGVNNPFRMNDQELARAAKRLVELRRNVLTFYATAEEAARLFSRYEIALVFGNYGNQQLKALRETGADIGYIIPAEGALAWLDCWVISPRAADVELAEHWIDFMLETGISRHLTDKHGLANTVTPIPDSRHDDKIIWLQPTAEPLKRKVLWDRIISGDGPETF